MTFSQRAPPTGCQQEKDKEGGEKKKKHLRIGRGVCYQPRCSEKPTTKEGESLASSFSERCEGFMVGTCHVANASSEAAFLGWKSH